MAPTEGSALGWFLSQGMKTEQVFKINFFPFILFLFFNVFIFPYTIILIYTFVFSLTLKAWNESSIIDTRQSSYLCIIFKRYKKPSWEGTKIDSSAFIKLCDCFLQNDWKTCKHIEIQCAVDPFVWFPII